MRTAGTFTTVLGASTSAARKSNSCGHFRGFLALATFASELSTSAYARSPSSPFLATSVAFSSSPIMDLTGYRQRETIEPTALCVGVMVGHLHSATASESTMLATEDLVGKLRRYHRN